jgi:hypothetical protein
MAVGDESAAVIENKSQRAQSDILQIDEEQSELETKPNH